MIRVLEITNPQELEKAFAIRKKVFVDEQKAPLEEEFDEFEENSIQLICYKGEISAGTARLRRTPKGIKLERICVLKEFRGADLGKSLVNKLLMLCKKEPGQQVYLYAQVSAIGFYSKFGFMQVGETFLDAGIEHIEMEYREKRNAN